MANNAKKSSTKSKKRSTKQKSAAKKKSTAQKKKSAAKRKSTAKKSSAKKTSAKSGSSSIEKVEGIEPVSPEPIRLERAKVSGDVEVKQEKKDKKPEDRPQTVTSGRADVGGVRRTDIITFYRQLVMLVQSGTPILKALRTLSQRGERQGIRNLVADLASYVESGNPLWQAFERHPKHFSPVEVHLVRASEASGTLPAIITRMAQYRERREMMRKRIIAAVLYPITVLVFGIGVLLIISLFVVPQFEEIFQQLDVQIPGYTQLFFTITKGLVNYFWVPIVLVVGLYLLYRFWWVKNPLRRLQSDRWKIKIWVFGDIAQKNALVEFLRTFALLQRAGLSMMATLDMVRHAIRNQAMVRTVQKIRDSVERGEGIEKPLREDADIVPPIVTDMLVTAEEAGNLDDTADQVADIQEEEATLLLDTVGEMILPIVVVIIGAVVLLLALALFVPLVDMMASITAGGGV